MRISDWSSDVCSSDLRSERRRHLAVRPLLDALFPPSPEILAPADDATIVCRCEEVTAGDIRAAVRLGATGPNQLKAFTRSEERSVGKESVSTCRSRWARYHKQKNKRESKNQ